MSEDEDDSTFARRSYEARAREALAAGHITHLPQFPKELAPWKMFRIDRASGHLPLFAVNSCREESRSIALTIGHGENAVELSITVGKGPDGRELGVLKQVHQDALMELFYAWGERGYPLLGDLGVLEMTAYELVMLLRGNDGEQHYRRAEQIVRDLATIPITLLNVRTHRGLRDRETFTLLHMDTWSERNIDVATRRPSVDGMSRVRILFSGFISDNFNHGYVQQLMKTAYDALGTRAEIAKLLYPRLCRELSGRKDRYHCKLEQLAQLIGLPPQRYAAQRARSFANAVAALNGASIADLYTLHVELVKAKDGKDYILHARRDSFQGKLPLIR